MARTEWDVEGSASMAVVEEKRPQTKENYVITEEEMAGLTPVDVSKHPYGVVKRLLDVVFSAIGLVILLAPIVVIALIIYVDDPGKVIFAQRRVGLGGKQFRVYKFRNCHEENDYGCISSCYGNGLNWM